MPVGPNPENKKEIENKSKSIFRIPSLIVANALPIDDNPDIERYLDFQMEPPTSDDDTRHYFESCVITPGVNRNMFEVTEEAMEMAAEGYKSGKPLSINHDKGMFNNTLGYGATVDAVVIDNKLYVLAYIALKKTYPKGPFGSAEELRDGMIDGFINSVSQSLLPLKARCSVCELPYPMSYHEYEMDGYCNHWRGQNVVVEDNGEKIVKTVHIIIEEAEATELSLVMIPADTGTGITDKNAGLIPVDFSLNDFIDEDRMKFLANAQAELEGGEGEDPELPEPSPEPMPELSGDPNKGDNPVSITQEQLDAMQKRASDAEGRATTLQADLNAANSNVTKLEGEVNTAKAEKATVEAEKATIQAQLEAEQNKVKLLEAAKELADAEATKKDTRIQELEKEAKENEIVLKDGQEARSSKIEAFADAYAKAIGDSCTEEMKERQREVAKSLTIAQIAEKIFGFEETAAVNYPAGKTVNNPNAGSGNGGGEEQQKPQLIGV